LLPPIVPPGARLELLEESYCEMTIEDELVRFQMLEGTKGMLNGAGYVTVTVTRSPGFSQFALGVHVDPAG